MENLFFQNIINQGILTKYFNHYKARQTFETNLSDLPNYPNSIQSTFIFPGHIIQHTKNTRFLGTIYHNFAILNNTRNKFTDDHNQSFIVLESETTHNKAFFNRIQNADQNKFEYIFAAIYPFNKTLFHKMKNYKVIIHNI